VVVTGRGSELPYDRIVLVIGAHPEREWRYDEVLTYHGGRDAHDFRRLLRQLEIGRVSRVAFVRPAARVGRFRSTSWRWPPPPRAMRAARTWNLGGGAVMFQSARPVIAAVSKASEGPGSLS
jgi:hypothetical protein